MAVSEWLWIKEPNFYCDWIFKLREDRANASMSLEIMLKNNDTSVQRMNYIYTFNIVTALK
jgi:hypothetical protein